MKELFEFGKGDLNVEDILFFFPPPSKTAVEETSKETNEIKEDKDLAAMK